MKHTTPGQVCRGTLCKGKWWPLYAFTGGHATCLRCRKFDKTSAERRVKEAAKSASRVQAVKQGQQREQTGQLDATKATRLHDTTRLQLAGHRLCSVQRCETYVAVPDMICHDCLVKLRMRPPADRRNARVEDFIYKDRES